MVEQMGDQDLGDEKLMADGAQGGNEGALRAGEAKTRAILNAMACSLFRFGQDGTCLEARLDRGLEGLIAPADLLGKKVVEVFPGEMAPRQIRAMEQALQTGRTQVYEYQVQVNGDWRGYEARTAPSGENEVLTIIRDITQRAGMYEQLKKNNARLATLQQINAIIHSGFPLDRVLRLVVENIRQGLGYDGVLVCLPDEGRLDLTIRAAAGQLDRFLMRRNDTPTRRISFAYDEAHNPLVAAFVEQHLRQTDAGAWLAALRDAGVPEMAQALEALEVSWGVALPLWHADQDNVIIGILGVLKHGQEAFSNDELQLLNSVGSQAALAVRNVHLFQAEQQGRREMEALYRAGLAITSAQPGQEVLRAIVQQIVELVGVEGCAICRWGPGSDGLVTELFLDKREDGWQEHTRPGTLGRLNERPTLRRVLVEQALVLLQDDGERVDPAERRWMAQEGIKSRLILPLVVRERSIGLLELTESRWRRNFTDRDLRIARGLAAQAALAMENARLHREELARVEGEMELAHRIQVSLLPQQAPRVSGLEFAARSLPARQVGGDFYRYLTLPGGRFGLVLGDVSGKGVPGALFMAMTITALDSQVTSCSTPADLLSCLNQALYPRLQTSRMNVGLLAAFFEPAGDGMQVSNAGMLYPLVVSGDSSWWLDVAGLPLGSLAAVNYAGREVALSDGALVVLASDGIVEAMNSQGELFGFDRLQAIVGAMRGDDPEIILEGVWQAASQHIGDAEPHDDMTLIVVRRHT
jgi:serine phosphatase RsbU (regulator of sigma subunit)